MKTLIVELPDDWHVNRVDTLLPFVAEDITKGVEQADTPLKWKLQNSGDEAGLEGLKQEAADLMDKFQELINRLPHNGDKCEDSQKVCIQIALNELEATVNGLVDDDLIEQEDY